MYSIRFFDNIDLWFTRDLETDMLPDDGFKNRIQLSEAFASDLEAHHPPIDLDAVKTWASAPGQLYFYLWLVFRCYTTRGESKIPLMGPIGIKEQCGVQGYEGKEGKKNFRKKVKKWLSAVKYAWPECPAVLTKEDKGDVLLINRSRTAIHERRVLQYAEE